MTMIAMHVNADTPSTSQRYLNRRVTTWPRNSGCRPSSPAAGLSDASPPDSLGSAERYAFLPEADTNNLLVAHAAPDYGIGTVGTCLWPIRRRRGLRKMAAEYFEHTLANRSVMFYASWMSTKLSRTRRPVTQVRGGAYDSHCVGPTPTLIRTFTHVPADHNTVVVHYLVSYTWSHYNLYAVGQWPYYPNLNGEDLSRHLNEIESVGLRKCLSVLLLSY